MNGTKATNDPLRNLEYRMDWLLPQEVTMSISPLGYSVPGNHQPVGPRSLRIINIDPSWHMGLVADRHRL